MTENEIKAIKWMECIKDDAMVTLDHIAKNEPKVNPLLYTGRKEKAETILQTFEELEQYRAIGTIERFQQLTEQFKPHLVDEISCPKRCCNKCDKYRKENEKYYAIGTVKECQETMEKQSAKKVSNRELLKDFNGNPYSVRGDCPNCGNTSLLSINTDYCSVCGQKLDWN